MSSPEDYPGAPRWIKALGVVALIALAIIVGMHLTGEGGLAHMLDHGRPTPSSTAP